MRRNTNKKDIVLLTMLILAMQSFYSCASTTQKRSIYVFSPDRTHIYFGDYPQSLVEDKFLSDTLSSKTMGLPSENSKGVWNNYEYYALGLPSNYMWYVDLSYDGENYRGVYFSQYRTANINYEQSIDNSYQDDNGFIKDNIYWFKYEPLTWKILSLDDEYALLMSEYIVDAQAFNTSIQSLENKYFPNNYKESSIRKWLNNTFYNLAFDERETSILQETLVDNGPSSSIIDSNEYLCENTNDFVWLLSNADTVNTSYGFSDSYTMYDEARRIKPTDYSKCQGVYVDPKDDEYPGCATWWLRSPDWYLDDCAFLINTGGYGQGRIPVNYTHGGVVPIVKIKMN